MDSFATTQICPSSAKQVDNVHIERLCSNTVFTKQAHSLPSPVLNPKQFLEYEVKTEELVLSLVVALILTWQSSEGSVRPGRVFLKATSRITNGSEKHKAKSFSSLTLQLVVLNARSISKLVASVLNRGTLQLLSIPPLAGFSGGPLLTPWACSLVPLKPSVESQHSHLEKPHGLGVTPWLVKPLPGREAVLGFCGMVGRAARLGFGDCRRGFGLVGVLEELRDRETVSTLGSVLTFFSGDPKLKRVSRRPGCSLGTEVKMGTKSTLYVKNQRWKKSIMWTEEEPGTNRCNRLLSFLITECLEQKHAGGGLKSLENGLNVGLPINSDYHTDDKPHNE